jgi:hypothetical protein
VRCQTTFTNFQIFFHLIKKLIKGPVLEKNYILFFYKNYCLLYYLHTHVIMFSSKIYIRKLFICMSKHSRKL